MSLVEYEFDLHPTFTPPGPDAPRFLSKKAARKARRAERKAAKKAKKAAKKASKQAKKTAKQLAKQAKQAAKEFGQNAAIGAGALELQPFNTSEGPVNTTPGEEAPAPPLPRQAKVTLAIGAGLVAYYLWRRRAKR